MLKFIINSAQLLFPVILLLCFPFSSYGQKELAEKENTLDVFNLANYSFLSKDIKDFLPTREVYADFFHLFQEQLPYNAKLIEIFVPNNYKHLMNQKFYNEITQLIYLYTMPTPLSNETETRTTQLLDIISNHEKILANFEQIEEKNSDHKKEFEEEVLTNLQNGKSIYFTTEPKNNEYLYNTLYNLKNNNKNSVQTLLSTYIFAYKNQVFFLTSSSILLNENIFIEFEKNKKTLENFKKDYLKLD